MQADFFHLVTRSHTGKPVCSPEAYGLEQAQTVREFHRSFPMYAATPLAKLTERVRGLETKQTLTTGENVLQMASFVLAFLLLGWCMIRLAGGSYNPFIYFRF